MESGTRYACQMLRQYREHGSLTGFDVGGVVWAHAIAPDPTDCVEYPRADTAPRRLRCRDPVDCAFVLDARSEQ
jgi:hypothetical protein